MAKQGDRRHKDRHKEAYETVNKSKKHWSHGMVDRVLNIADALEEEGMGLMELAKRQPKWFFENFLKRLLPQQIDIQQVVWTRQLSDEELQTQLLELLKQIKLPAGFLPLGQNQYTKHYTPDEQKVEVIDISAETGNGEKVELGANLVKHPDFIPKTPPDSGQISETQQPSASRYLQKERFDDEQIAVQAGLKWRVVGENPMKRTKVDKNGGSASHE